MDRAIKVTASITFLFYLALAAQFTNIQVLKQDKLNKHPGNPRHLEREIKKGRGRIVSADGKVLAESVLKGSRYQRKYPYGEAAAPVTGYLSLRYGRTGLEKSYDNRLSGKGRIALPSLTASDPNKIEVKVTIDAELQRQAYVHLRGMRGSVVAIDPRTGAVLAMVSAPSADPNYISDLSLEVENKYWEAIQQHGGKLLLNRATQEWYPPGSSWKVVTLASAFSSGMEPDELVGCPSKIRLPQSTKELRNFGGSGYSSVTLARAMEVSCNTTFAQIGMGLGAQRLEEAAALFGVSSRPPFDLPVIKGNVPESASFNQAALAMSSIGQLDIRATPMHMALVAAGVANGGKIMEPYLVERVEHDGLIVSSRKHRIWKTPLSPELAGKLSQVMEGVVLRGTGRRAFIRDFRVAGKTGTAEAPGGAPHAWFIAYAPVNDPKIALAVLVERGGSMGDEATGGRVAAPIARKLIEDYLSP